MTTSPQSKRLAVFLAASATILLWASAFVGIRVAARAFEGGALALLRFGVASLAFLGAAAVRRPTRPSRTELVPLVLVGLVGVALYHASLNQGERTVPAGTASLLVNASPIFTALLARVRLGERLGALGTAGVLLGFSGVAILAGSTGEGVRLEVGAGLVLVSALAQATSFVLQKPLLGRLRAVDVTTWSVWIGTAALLPFAPQLVRAMGSAPREAVLAAVYLGVFPGALANALWAFVLSRVPASRAAAWLYAVAPIVMLMGWALLGETPTAAAVVGGGVTLVGVALTVKRPRPAAVRASASSCASPTASS